MIRSDMMLPDLFAQYNADRKAAVRFDGQTYEHSKDSSRLAAQMNRVRELMADGHWRTLAEIEAVTGDPQASVSARLRDLRKERFGQHTVERRRRGPGTFEYRLAS